ncbi:hypothetical protein MKW92_020199 [Papaver armeniacum]|nr:hypothetical protein MKW92_020199 [Papaver armeniacum]
MRNSFLYFGLLSLFTILFFSKSSHQADSPCTPNPRLQSAFKAIQKWKKLITADPKNFTSNWNGPDVCNYNGVFCAPAPDNSHIDTVASIDLNEQNIAGALPEELGLLTDLAIFHINSNQFSESYLKLDISNNLFAGKFPKVVLSMPALKYLDIRFNNFEGSVPSKLFDMQLDAIFINNNNFQFSMPANFANSTASAIVLANNHIDGCLPSNIEKMAGTLNEMIVSNNGLSSCLPPEIGKLVNLTILDVGFNSLIGPLPKTMGNLKNLEILNVAHNELSGDIPPTICSLRNLETFTYSNNNFGGEPQNCSNLNKNGNRQNRIPNPNMLPQRPDKRFSLFHSQAPV